MRRLRDVVNALWRHIRRRIDRHRDRLIEDFRRRARRKEEEYRKVMFAKRVENKTGWRGRVRHYLRNIIMSAYDYNYTRNYYTPGMLHSIESNYYRNYISEADKAQYLNNWSLAPALTVLAKHEHCKSSKLLERYHDMKSLRSASAYYAVRSWQYDYWEPNPTTPEGDTNMMGVALYLEKIDLLIDFTSILGMGRASDQGDKLVIESKPGRRFMGLPAPIGAYLHHRVMFYIARQRGGAEKRDGMAHCSLYVLKRRARRSYSARKYRVCLNKPCSRRAVYRVRSGDAG